MQTSFLQELIQLELRCWKLTFLEFPRSVCKPGVCLKVVPVPCTRAYPIKHPLNELSSPAALLDIFAVSVSSCLVDSVWTPCVNLYNHEKAIFCIRSKTKFTQACHRTVWLYSCHFQLLLWVMHSRNSIAWSSFVVCNSFAAFLCSSVASPQAIFLILNQWAILYWRSGAFMYVE